MILNKLIEVRPAKLNWRQNKNNLYALEAI